MHRLARLTVLLCLSAMSLSEAGWAAPVGAPTKAMGQVTLLQPLTLVRLNDMDFAMLAVTTGGTATIDPVTGAMTVTGGLVHSGGTPSPARYAGAASKRTVINIKVPKNPVLIRRVGGTETLSVSNFTLDGQDKKALAEQQAFTFAVGAQITVPAGTIEGIYTGEIDVTVQYP